MLSMRTTLSGRERLVFQAPGNVGLKDISRDGRVLLQRGIPRSRMMVFTAGSEKERDLAWFDYSTSADISADGKSLLFYEQGTAVGSVPFVYLRKMDGSNEPVRLGQGKPFALSPDGKWALAVQESSQPQLVLLYLAQVSPGCFRAETSMSITMHPGFLMDNKSFSRGWSRATRCALMSRIYQVASPGPLPKKG